MEPEGSLPLSQTSATCPYPGPAQSSPHSHIPPPGDKLYTPDNIVELWLLYPYSRGSQPVLRGALRAPRALPRGSTAAPGK